MSTIDHYFMKLPELHKYHEWLVFEQRALPAGTEPVIYKWYEQEIQDVLKMIQKRQEEREVKLIEDRARAFMASPEVRVPFWQSLIQSIKDLFH